MTGATRTTCPYCGVGCGVLAQRAASGAVEIAGDSRHPANHGRLCSKGTALGNTLGLDDRLLDPVVDGRRSSWDEALNRVANGLRRAIDEHGRESVAFYVSGQLLTEDYYVVNKLMKGFIGAANIDTNSRLCMASAVAGHKRAFGEDIVPVCYEDLEIADLIVLVGSNTAWCHPVVFQRISRARELRPDLKIVVIDPRRTPTCEIAHLHLPIRAGSDVWLFNGLLTYLRQHGHANTAFLQAHTMDADVAEATASSSAGSVRAVAQACGIDETQLTEFFALFANTERVITAFSQGVNQSSAGTDKVNSIINCHLLTGRIGRPGMGPFSITGQPNAMGGREVGGLANTLAAHMDIGNASHRQLVQEFWNSPLIATQPGLKAVDLFHAVHDGRIKALWIVATNPAVSLPDANKVREAIARCPFVVVSDCSARTDTTALAHVLLPAAAWGEKDGTVTNSERCISRQRAFLHLPGEARPDWWIVCEVAKRMGFARGFDYQHPCEIFDEHARLSAAGNDSARAFDIRGLIGLSRTEYDALDPIQWPVLSRGSGTQRLFGNGRFHHVDGKARLVSTPPRLPVHAPDEDYPFVLNTGRIRDQWHTMTRTGKAPRLLAHLSEPYIDLHPQDALLTGVRAGDLARVATRWGSFVAKLRMSGETARGTAFVPIHWNDQFASDARAGALVSPAVDPISGEPEFKHTPARVEPFRVTWHGFVLARAKLAALDVTWWTRIAGEQFLRYELAGRSVPADWSTWARTLLGAGDPDADYLDYHDVATGDYRGAWLVEDRLAACIFLSPRTELPPRSWLAELFTKERLSASDRFALLAGVPAAASADPGPVVCSCFGIGHNTIRDAISRHQLTDARQIGARLKAGTNCGSCLPEIRMLLQMSSRAG
ncbi:MAG TPA: molybdopterin-dependent oxidoreductase [Steroidobacteraceae bacterium]|nr:molybdopterin-dependent oxidoreductase [Steroidobacteraceae bacterium]